ncbi:hypothetical protein [Nocardioides gansuensis]|uniref:hypothetical protein n=1 Tax=Nocardioides gansuensis TaxID=2138300 RepID=UPI001FE2F14F|nr:hypothetical protein [Nocardioides gansuensis]
MRLPRPSVGYATIERDQSELEELEDAVVAAGFESEEDEPEAPEVDDPLDEVLDEAPAEVEEPERLSVR